MFLLRAGVAAAGDHGKGLPVTRLITHGNRLDVIDIIAAPRAQACTAEVAAVIGRHRHHTEHHPTMLDQRDVDGELFTP
ncbi:hypothetical protein ALP29_200359 [Pseudomonas syringae pv. avii]|uniref:Uncharacterized protein n=1 Tax=Pseudomonas syringae pv. avii TaxID=663959 RepID=A0A3M5VI65_PSESX|nr:hypothetical protein ALP29_200359 [Pseudomonas syringae pv. avii]